MLDNLIIFKNYKNVNLNFSNNLRIKDSIIFKDCSNFNIIINSKINKISIINCKNFNLTFNDCISGIDIEKAYNLTIYREYNNEKLNLVQIDIFRSNVIIIYDNIFNILDYKIIGEDSNISFNHKN